MSCGWKIPAGRLVIGDASHGMANDYVRGRKATALLMTSTERAASVTSAVKSFDGVRNKQPIRTAK